MRWRNSSEDIARNVPSQWETPQGAQEKANKAEQNAKDYSDQKLSDHKRKGGNEHPLATQSDNGFMSANDKSKLDGIESGAQANKNAFGKINGMAASTPDDSFAIEGRTGIIVTEDAANKRVILDASGDVVPGNHGWTHDLDGEDPIPDLVQLKGDFDAHKAETATELAKKADKDWTSPIPVTAQNGWTGTIYLRKNNSLGLVLFYGNVVPGVKEDGTVILTLPEGFRPYVASVPVVGQQGGSNIARTGFVIGSGGSFLVRKPAADDLYLGQGVNFSTIYKV